MKDIKDQQIENLILAAWRWSETKADRIIPRLCDWRCGTQACFGGHLVTWPEFADMGVRPYSAEYQEPVMPSLAEGLYSSSAVARELFGCGQMFFPRIGEKGTDHAVIVNRLEAQFERLTA